MNDAGYSLYRGEVWFPNPASLSTLVRLMDVKEFICGLMGNPLLMDTLDGKLDFIVKVLGDKQCSIVPQFEIDMDTIKVRELLFLLHLINSNFSFEIEIRSIKTYIYENI